MTLTDTIAKVLEAHTLTIERNTYAICHCGEKIRYINQDAAQREAVNAHLASELSKAVQGQQDANADKYEKALLNHLCPYDMADWIACAGHDPTVCMVCAIDGDHDHEKLRDVEQERREVRDWIIARAASFGGTIAEHKGMTNEARINVLCTLVELHALASHSSSEPAAPVSESQPLKDAVEFAERVAPLPRCKHGMALRDGSGEFLEPPCGCRFVAGSERLRGEAK